jgi:hypothetical protein
LRGKVLETFTGTALCQPLKPRGPIRRGELVRNVGAVISRVIFEESVRSELSHLDLGITTSHSALYFRIWNVALFAFYLFPFAFTFSPSFPF